MGFLPHNMFFGPRIQNHFCPTAYPPKEAAPDTPNEFRDTPTGKAWLGLAASTIQGAELQ